MGSEVELRSRCDENLSSKKSWFSCTVLTVPVWDLGLGSTHLLSSSWFGWSAWNMEDEKSNSRSITFLAMASRR